MNIVNNNVHKKFKKGVSPSVSKLGVLLGKPGKYSILLWWIDVFHSNVGLPKFTSEVKKM